MGKFVDLKDALQILQIVRNVHPAQQDKNYFLRGLDGKLPDRLLLVIAQTNATALAAMSPEDRIAALEKLQRESNPRAYSMTEKVMEGKSAVQIAQELSIEPSQMPTSEDMALMANAAASLGDSRQTLVVVRSDLVVGPGDPQFKLALAEAKTQGIRYDCTANARDGSVYSDMVVERGEKPRGCSIER